ncbi:hypothetical protein L226DRAFT_559647 [Lentinus tigrinus ALCF2SS1-7]|uniref:HMG box domain-containing protein n=1 Tax=Lentinus tigrinus ALCF2SS1-6 TaxID=1328759 RepID=A0A5C2SLH7_9APHY|nr:hypothetical protein L227DRAFT_598738 [Lentinus tigrinus ALCF2SS1-6]RPD76713.1 hypothetical protein L226DRAFT_559647 [Lentinus tigrinus ALCF2SS1-7]
MPRLSTRPASAGPEPIDHTTEGEEEEEEEHIPRPPNSWILFRKDCCDRAKLSGEGEGKPQKVLSKEYGAQWKKAPKAVRAYYDKKAKEALEEHKRKYPKYKYRPGPPKYKDGVKIAPPAPRKKRGPRKKAVALVMEADVGGSRNEKGDEVYGGSSRYLSQEEYPDPELQATFHDQGSPAARSSDEVMLLPVEKLYRAPDADLGSAGDPSSSMSYVEVLQPYGSPSSPEHVYDEAAALELVDQPESSDSYTGLFSPYASPSSPENEHALAEMEDLFIQYDQPEETA